MSVQLEKLGIPYVVLERQPEPGGTWAQNRYPDVRVDTISITYEFSFEKNYPWSEYFGRGAEVRKYLDYISKKYGPHDKILFNRSLKKATFDEDRNIWVLEVDFPDGVETIECNYLVNAVGTFTNPNYPNFEGQESFEGQILHPSRWPADFDASGKRIAVIGNGSTGVQLLSPDLRRRRRRSSSSSAPRSGSARVTSTARRSSPRSAGCSTTSRATGTGGATWPSPPSSRRTGSWSPTRSGRPRAASSTR